MLTPDTTLADRAAQVELGVYPRLPLVPVRGAGCYLYDADGHAYLDLYAGHAVALTGHCHPHVVAAIKQQAEQLIFYSNAVHCEARVAASELLLAHAPHADSRVFYCCSGSEANEVAMKIARKATGRPRIVSFERSFHGRTTTALAASGLEKYRETAGIPLDEHHARVPLGDVDALRAAVTSDTAAVLCEGIQSLGGIHLASADFYQQMAAIARDAGALVIFDEVQTAFGRTGSYFFADSVGVRPDLLTMAKGIASGLPVGAVLVAPHVARHVARGDQGSTFGGGPVPMAAMRATLEVVDCEHLVENAGRVGGRIIAAARNLPHVRSIRGQGLLIGIELDVPARDVQQALYERRILAGSSSDPAVLRLLPPLTLSTEQADTFLAALSDILRTIHGSQA